MLSSSTVRLVLGASAGLVLGATATFGPHGSAAAADPPQPGGDVLFKTRGCAMCHSLTPGRNLNGPSLAGVYGRAVAKAPGYSYSKDLAALGGTWDAKRLDRWLADPRAMAAGTKMAVKLASPRERAAVIAYLQQKPVK